MSDDAVALLTRIDARIADLIELLAARLEPAEVPQSDLDSSHGNPMASPIAHPHLAGRRLSDCTVEELDQQAQVFSQLAWVDSILGSVTAAGKPRAAMRKLAAARARAWARRRRSELVVAAASEGIKP